MKAKKSKEAELRMAVFVAHHTSFKAAPQLASLISNLSEHIPKLGRTKVSMIIKNVLAPSYKPDLVEKDKPFSLVIDEASDVSMQKALGIMIRYPDLENGEIVDTFYRLIPVSRGNAETLSLTMKTAMEEDGVDISWMTGMGLDGAMVGCHHSVSTILSDAVPHLIVVCCVAHLLAKVCKGVHVRACICARVHE